jgi:hypothetical protein
MDTERGRRVARIQIAANSWRLGDLIRLVLLAPLWVRDLIDHIGELRSYYDGQLAKRDRDLQELVGRRSVELEAAGREGYRQGSDSAGVADFPATPFNLGLVIAAAQDARPNVVTGELTMVGKSRAGA